MALDGDTTDDEPGVPEAVVLLAAADAELVTGDVADWPLPKPAGPFPVRLA